MSNESSRQTFMHNEVEEDRERDGPTSSSTTWRTCGSRWRTQGIVPNGEGEPVCTLTPHQRDSQPEGERELLARLTIEAYRLMYCRTSGYSTAWLRSTGNICIHDPMVSSCNLQDRRILSSCSALNGSFLRWRHREAGCHERLLEVS